MNANVDATVRESSPYAGAPRNGVAAGIGAVAAAMLASLCCIGPIVFVTLGVGAGLASRFEPLRPLFTLLTICLLGIGFYTVYGRRPAPRSETCGAPDGASHATGTSCSVPQHRTRDQFLLWGATILAVLVLTFPQWSLLFI